MLCKDIIKMLEDTYPKHAALEWDNVGLLVGRAEKDVKKIYVALDATEEVIDDAIGKGIDMLVTHHPLIFEPLKQITDESYVGSRVVRLLQHDISYYAMHTNYDVLRMADLSAVRLGLTNMEVLEITGADGVQESGMTDVGSVQGPGMADAHDVWGIGKVGDLPGEMTLQQCCELVKEKFQLETVKVFGKPEQKVKRVAISPGSGKHMSELALRKQADLFITGDIDHHEGMDAVEQGLTIMDAGHYGLEHIFINDVASYFKEHLKEIEVRQAEIKHPFFVI